MTGGLRKWVGELPPDSKREALLHAAENGARGLLNARDDIRQKLIDEGWFNRSTMMQEGSEKVSENPSPEPSPVAEHGTGESKAVRRADLYGADLQSEEGPEMQTVNQDELYGPEAVDREPEM